MAKVRLSPRQEAKARRNAELRDLANQIAERDEALEVARLNLKNLWERFDRLEADAVARRAIPVESIHHLFEAMPVAAVIRHEIMDDCLRVQRWLERMESIADAEANVATSNMHTRDKT